MIIYYTRVTTWQKWPNNDCIDTDEVIFSVSKKRFDGNTILTLDPQVNMEDRKTKVAEVLGIDRKKVKLQKL